LIGKTKGATVIVETPGGAKAYKVSQVKWFEDKRRKRERA
jgi:transcription elongation factor GreA